MTRNNEVLDEIVKESSKLDESEFDGKYTKTALFMLPSVDIDLRNRLISKYISNAFLNDMEHEHDYVRPIFVLFSVSLQNEVEWRDLCKVLRTKNPCYLDDYYVGKESGKHLIMYIFSVPDKWKADYFLFKRARYSKFSDEYKSKFPEKVTSKSGTDIESLVWGAMHKSNNLKAFIKKRFAISDSIVDEMEEIWGELIDRRENYRYKGA